LTICDEEYDRQLLKKIETPEIYALPAGGHLLNGLAPLRFTCAHFQNLDKLWDRLQHEYPCPVAGGLRRQPA
jgi:hypothetical protein